MRNIVTNQDLSALWFTIPLATILATLSLLHAYWALGGRWGVAVTIPVVDGRRAFNPGPLATWLVCGLLAVGVALVMCRSRMGLWGLAAAFLLRAIGEFRMAGFFKSITDTEFARWDTWLYSPLCLLIALLAAGAIWSNPDP